MSQAPDPVREPRSIPMAEPVFCGICRWPVRLLTSGRHVVLVEVFDGARRPHRCPQEAIDRYEAAERLRRWESRRRPVP